MDTTVSRNFSIAKVLAIFVVVTSHWFKDIDLWVLASIALFLFGFSSAYFTGCIYGVGVDVRAFWNNKLRRLGVRYWLILGVLAVIVTLQGRDIFHWHSIVHLVGLSGVLNLFGSSASALGNGLWFFTLLLLFYAAYPLLAPRLLASARTTIVIAAATVGLVVLDQTLRLGFSLWLTMLGFLIGIYAGVNRLRLNTTVLNVVLVAIPLLIAVANVVFRVREFNTVLLISFSLAVSLRLTRPGLWLGGLGFLVPLEACLLEIYLIHTYLFIHPTGNSVVDFMISLVLIVIAAILLSRAGNNLITLVFRKASVKPAAVAVAHQDDEHLEGAA